jgi:predicted permease
MVSKIIRFADVSPDIRVFCFLFGASLLAVFVFALLPALQATRTSVVAASRGQFAEGGRPSRLRQSLVIVQVTVCALLLICAGILLQASRQMAERDPGYQTAGVSAVALNQALAAPVIDSLRTQPWAEAVAIAWRAPLSGGLRGIPAAAIDKPQWIRAGYNFVSPEYFDLLRIPILHGRNFTSGEADGEAQVVIVSESTASKLWPGQNPLGQAIRIAPSEWQIDRYNRLPKYRRAEVIGIAPDVISGMVMEGKDASSLYSPTSAKGQQNEALLIRLRPATAASLESFLDSKATSAILRVVSLEELLATQIYPFRLSAAISSLLGGLALVLTLSGMYGVLSYLVTQRTREIGIRMALGATVPRVVGMIVWQSALLAGVGALLGGLLALGVSRIFASAVQNVRTFDPLAYTAGVGAVLLAALVAAVFPSRKAAGIEPSTTLRLD